MSAAPALDFSFEFFPPRTPQGRDKLRATWQQLAQLKPRFFSVTFGAGGSTREGTLDTVLEIRNAGHEAAPHISYVASTRADVAGQLELYRKHGIRHIFRSAILEQMCCVINIAKAIEYLPHLTMCALIKDRARALRQ